MRNSVDLKSAQAAPRGFTPKRGRPSANQREAISRTILSAATTIFQANGYDATSMDGIAALAGVPKSTLYKRFPDKRGLLRAVITARVAEWSAIASRKNWMLTEDLEQRLTHYCAWLLVWASSPEVRVFSGLALSAWNAAEETDQRLDVVGFGRMVDLITQEIAQFGPAGGIRAKDPRRVAMALMAQLSGCMHMRSSNMPIGEAEASAIADQTISLLMHGSAAW